MTTLCFEQLETLYDELATAIDQAGPERESVFLAKLALCMAQEWGDGARVSALIRECLHEPAPVPGAQKMI
ncbi:MAG: DUF2783 domain-containing protein [Variovorax sp.]|nr:DUF2783 domain-containing protein [Variovorax sp.]